MPTGTITRTQFEHINELMQTATTVLFQEDPSNKYLKLRQSLLNWQETCPGLSVDWAGNTNTDEKKENQNGL
jgi:hypothetical protein